MNIEHTAGLIGKDTIKSSVCLSISWALWPESALDIQVLGQEHITGTSHRLEFPEDRQGVTYEMLFPEERQQQHIHLKKQILCCSRKIKIMLKVQVLLPKIVALLKEQGNKPWLCFVERKNFFYKTHAAILRTDELLSPPLTAINPAKFHVMGEVFTKQTPCCKSHTQHIYAVLSPHPQTGSVDFWALATTTFWDQRLHVAFILQDRHYCLLVQLTRVHHIRQATIRLPHTLTHFTACRSKEITPMHWCFL